MRSVRRSSLLLLIIFLINVLPVAPGGVPFAETSQAMAAAVPPQPQVHTSGPLQQRELASLTLHLAVAPDPVVVGSTATISVTVTNQSAHAARGLTVTLPVPDGAVPVSGPGLVSPSEGWNWSQDQLNGGTSTTFTATIRLARLPRGQALLAHVQAHALGLELPIQEIAGALALEHNRGEAHGRFTPGQATTMRSSDGGVEVHLPGRAFQRALTLSYSR